MFCVGRCRNHRMPPFIAWMLWSTLEIEILYDKTRNCIALELYRAVYYIGRRRYFRSKWVYKVKCEIPIRASRIKEMLYETLDNMKFESCNKGHPISIFKNKWFCYANDFVASRTEYAPLGERETYLLICIYEPLSTLRSCLLSCIKLCASLESFTSNVMWVCEL